MVTRRRFLATASLSSLSYAVGRGGDAARAAGPMQVGYAAITWGANVSQAIDDIAAVGFRGIQLRAGDGTVTRYGANPTALRDLLAEKHLAFAVLSSGNLSIDPAREREMIDTHTRNAKFLHDAGGRYLQMIDERPKNRAVTADDYRRVGRLLTEIGKRTADVGVTTVYHHHMNSTGEKPAEVAAVLDAADRKHVRLLFDIAHYQQGGGDPVAAIRKYREWIDVVHLKDVRDKPAAGAGGYEFIELGRGRVDVAGALAALADIGFDKWAIVELDRVVDPGRTPKQAAEINKQYLTGHGINF